MNTKLQNLIVLFVLLSMAGCASKAAKEKPAKPVKVKAVETHVSTGAVRYSASIRAAAQVDVAFRVSGYIDSIAKVKDQSGQWRHIQAGDIVSKGTVLAQVRQNDFAARVNEAKSQSGEARSALESYNAQLKEATAAVETSKAQVHEAQASYDRAKLDFGRSKALFESQSITKADYDAAKATYETATAKLEAAKSQLEVAQAKIAIARSQIGMGESRVKSTEAATVSATIPLSDTQLRAPMSAVVIDRKIEVGTLVGQGTAGFVLADLSFVKVAFGVPDNALKSLQLGDTLAITTDAVQGTEFKGHVSRISPSADQSSRVFDVEVTIPNPEGTLKPGMIASVSVTNDSAEQSQQETQVVPLVSITKSKVKPDGYAVFIAEEHDGRTIARLRDVELGQSYGNAVAVISGVQAGERVITSGATQVTDGERVQVVP